MMEKSGPQHIEQVLSNETFDEKQHHHNIHAVEDYELDVFARQEAEKAGDYVEFRSLGWFKAGLLACAEFLAIGMLSFPSIFMRLGMVGGLLATLAFSILGYIMAWIIVDFKCKHMGVMNYADAGGLMWGRWGFWLCAVMLVVKSMFLAGSHAVVGAEAFQVMTNHKICNVWWGLIVTVLSVIFSLPRKWNSLGLLSFVSVGCIVVASIMTTVVVARQDPSVLMKKGVPIKWYAVHEKPTLLQVVGGLTNVLFSFGGNQAIIAFVSEMKDPQEFKKSFAMSQSFGVTMQTVVGATIYAYGGQYTTSPALTMASRNFQIAAYAIAMVTIIISGVVAVNVGVKFMYITALRNSPLLTSRGWRAQAVWVGFLLVHWVAGFIIAELIPFFNDLLTIISACTSVWFSYGFCGMMWFYDNLPRYQRDNEPPRHLNLRSPKTWFWISVSVIGIVLSIVITPLGLYTAAMGIRSGYASSKYGRPFMC